MTINTGSLVTLVWISVPNNSNDNMDNPITAYYLFCNSIGTNKWTYVGATSAMTLTFSINNVLTTVIGYYLYLNFYLLSEKG